MLRAGAIADKLAGLVADERRPDPGDEEARASGAGFWLGLVLGSGRGNAQVAVSRSPTTWRSTISSSTRFREAEPAISACVRTRLIWRGMPRV